jgi:hypothetical protein
VVTSAWRIVDGTATGQPADALPGYGHLVRVRSRQRR